MPVASRRTWHTRTIMHEPWRPGTHSRRALAWGEKGRAGLGQALPCGSPNRGVQGEPVQKILRSTYIRAGRCAARRDGCSREQRECLGRGCLPVQQHDVQGQQRGREGADRFGSVELQKKRAQQTAGSLLPKEHSQQQANTEKWRNWTNRVASEFVFTLSIQTPLHCMRSVSLAVREKPNLYQSSARQRLPMERGHLLFLVPVVS